MVMPKKILVADNNEIDRKVLERWCMKEAHDYSICLNGNEA
jgi:CheY-like chemotaxis protein